MSENRQRPARACFALLLTILLALLWVVLGLSAQSASGVAATVIGKTQKTPKPSCPTPLKDGEPDPNAPLSKRCQGVGELSALQVRADGEVNPYKIPSAGRIVAWSIDLARPSESEIAFFTDAPPGGPDVSEGVGWGEPSARISILKKLKRQRFKLVKQSAKIDLSSYLGSSPIFTLRKPLRVKAGLFVAITTPGWMPTLAHDEPVTSPEDDAWLASRGQKHCGTFPAGASNAEIVAAQQDAIDNSKPQQRKGTIRPYKCRYTAARLLYSAFLAPDNAG